MKTQTEIKRSFRIVTQKGNHEDVKAIEELLRDEEYEFEEDIFYPLARRCTTEIKALGSSLAHFFGYIYIQDRASMLPPVALNPKENEIILDMCASPGSKTSMLSAMLYHSKSGSSLVIGNEPNPTRLQNLKRNLETMQCMNAITCNYDGSDIPLKDASFSSIVLDPPCSGWGTINKNPNVKEIWTEEKAQNLVALQKELLKEAVRLLKMGGTLIYSTCTTNVKENEEQVEFACKELGLELIPLGELENFELTEVDALSYGIKHTDVWRLEPKIGDTQGFFVAKFKKVKDIEIYQAKKENKKEKIKFTREDKSFDFLTIKEIEEYHGKATLFANNIHFLPEKAIELAEKNNNFRFQAMHMGKFSGSQVQIAPRLRLFDNIQEKIHFETKEDLKTLYGLLQGQSLNYTGKELLVPFYWKNLYLGNLKKKGNRLLWVVK